MQGCHVAILLGKPDVSFRLRFITVFSLQASWQSSFIHITDGRQVVVANPVPQLQLGVSNDGRHIHHCLDILHGIALWLLVVHTTCQTDILCTSTEGHQHAHTLHHHVHPLRNGIGKGSVQRHR